MDEAEYTIIRNKALEILREKGGLNYQSDKSLEEIIEELSIYKIEIEMQNDELRKLNESLNKEKERFKALFDYSPVGNLIIDFDFNVLEISQKGCEFFEGNTQQIIGKDFRYFISKNNQDDFYLALKNLSTNNFFNMEVVLISLYGRKFDANLTIATDLKNENKQLYRISIINISDKKLTEKKLKESYSQYQSLVDTIALSIYRIDLNSIITFANNNFCNHFDLKPDSILGKHLSEIFSPALSWSIEMNNELCLRMDAPLTVLEEHTKENCNHEGILEVLRTPVKDDNGENIGIQVVQWDITERIKQERQLKESEYRLRKLVEDSADLFLICEISSKVIFIGSNSENIIGYSNSELLDKFFKEKIHDDYKSIFEKSLYLNDEEEQINSNLVCRFLHKSGTWIWLEIAITNLTNDKQINGIILNIRDISERVEAQRKIAEAELLYRSLFDFLPDGIILFDPQTTSSIEFNQTAYKQLGYSKEEFAHLKVNDFDVIETPEETKRRINQILQFGYDEFETLHKRKDGSIRPTYVKVQIVEIKGKPYILSLFHDLSDYKESIKKKEESEVKFRSLIENAFDGIYLMSDRKYVYTNQRFSDIIGYSTEEILSPDFDFSILLTDASREVVEKRYKLRQQGKDVDKQYEIQIQTKSGIIKYIEIATETIIFDDDVSIIGIVRDVTDRKIQQEELIQAKIAAEKSADVSNTILNNLGHELRTPLNGILGFSKILKMDIEDEELLDMVKMIEMSGERLKKTLSALLVLTELDSMKYEISYDLCELNTFISMYDQSTIELIQPKPIDFELILSDENIEFMTDEYLLHQAIYELLDNAYKFTNSGKITIKVSKAKIESSEKALIQISDTGIGIPEDKLDVIFEPFRQGSEGIQRKHEGMGLGLTIVNKIIEKLKGIIIVESKIGEGTTVNLLFDISKR